MSEKPATRCVYLTDDELVLLDGACRPEVQATVEIAKSALAIRRDGLSDRDAAFVALVLGEAAKEGRLIWRPTQIRYCTICANAAPTIAYGRNGRRLRTPRNTLMPAVELARRFVTITNHVSVGGCAECVGRLLPHLRARLADVRAEIPEAITGHAPRWRWNQNRRCTACGWEGHEGEMGRAPTLFGHGTYPAICPKCAATNAPFGRDIVEIVSGGFTVTAVTAVQP